MSVSLEDRLCDRTKRVGTGWKRILGTIRLARGVELAQGRDDGSEMVVDTTVDSAAKLNRLSAPTLVGLAFVASCVVVVARGNGGAESNSDMR